MVTKSMVNIAPSGIVTAVPVINKAKTPLKKEVPASPTAMATHKASKGKAEVKKTPMGQCAYCKYPITRHGSQHKVEGKATWFHYLRWKPYQERQTRKKAKSS